MQKFTQISPRAFEHPADRAALSALRKIRGFDLVLKKILGLFGEKRLRLMHLASSVRVNSNQRPDIFQLHNEVCQQFDLEQVPELFISYSAFMNAAAIGVDHPFIILNSSLVERLSPKELQYVIAHEVGHILCGHSLYRTLLYILMAMTDKFVGIPRLLFWPILVGLYEWHRKSELSADRAGALSVNSLETTQTVIMKMCGADGSKQFNLEEFEKQGAEYEKEGDLLDNVYKFLNVIFASHPFPVTRLKEIRTFHQSDQFKEILAGKFPVRDQSDRNRLSEDIKIAKETYSENLESLFGNFSESVSEFLGGIESKTEKVLDAIFNSRKKDQ